MIATTGNAILVLVAVLRWTSVAQKEHYETGRVVRIAQLWINTRPVERTLLAIGLALLLASLYLGSDLAITASSVILASIPAGMIARLNRGSLKWTRRATRLVLGSLVITSISAVVLYLLLGIAAGPVLILAMPVLIDVTLRLLAPVEASIGQSFLNRAVQRLARVSPTVVAITGSYGKTSTKNYLSHIVQTSYSTLASPASFNNLMGLSSAVNKHLTPGIEVFIAEMGTYGPGEIRKLCELFQPKIVAITSIGEAHLERMGSRSAILAAKSEITENADTVVLNADVPELRNLAEECRVRGQRVILCGTVAHADIDVTVVMIDKDTCQATYRCDADGSPCVAQFKLPFAAHRSNAAVAIGLAVALETSCKAIQNQTLNLPTISHRAEIAQDDQGTWVVDDTFNSNPDGAATALASAKKLADEIGSELVVVTPGMIELGAEQYARNAQFAELVKESGTLFVVGWTNRKALTNNGDNKARVRTFSRREPAVRAAHEAVGPGGVILFENDLPTHYP